MPCPNCGVHIKRSDPSCLHCGATLGVRGSTFAPLLLPMALGLLLAGCGDDGVSGSGDGTTAGGTMGSTMTVGGTASVDSSGPMADSFGDEAAYGVATSGFDSTTTAGTTGDTSTGGSDSGSDSGTTGGDSGTTAATGETDTGATTGGTGSGSTAGETVGEPEYGVPTTGIEPLYGVVTTNGS